MEERESGEGEVQTMEQEKPNEHERGSREERERERAVLSFHRGAIKEGSLRERVPLYYSFRYTSNAASFFDLVFL